MGNLDDGAVSPELSGASGPDSPAPPSSLEDLADEFAEDYVIPESVAGHFRWPVRVLTAMAALFMFGIGAVTVVDVSGRYVFNSPVPGGVEIIEFLLGLMIFSALPLVTVKRSHITVELFDGFMSARFKKVREALVLIASAAMIIFITERMWSTAIYMLENDEVSLHLEVQTAPLLFTLTALSAISAITQIYMIWKYLALDIRDLDREKDETL
ncbi:MAG: TRAP-type C4-dicarboxylate transport system permease small subunit [Paracoccaceae bacterium]|jgi:TRAP-type C4-dicarboxylate transport system permease small subunit